MINGGNPFVEVFPTTESISQLKEVRHLLTLNCNLRCLHCYMNGGEHPNVHVGRFSQAQADAFYGRFRPEEVSATGGEPLLEYDQVKILARATANYGGALELVTNGWFLTKDIVAELNDLNPKTFYQISLDGLKPWHDYQRNMKGAFDRAMAAINAASESGHLTKVRMTVSDGNIKDVTAVIEHLDRLGRANVSLVMRPAVPSGRALGNKITLSGEGSFKALDNFKSAARVISVQTTDNMGKCGCGVDTVAIDPSGTIFPCTYFIFKPEYVMGTFGAENLTLHQDARFAGYKGTCYARHAGQSSSAATLS